jgi:hypothetical protein
MLQVRVKVNRLGIDEWEIKLSNWPKDPSSRANRPVRLERLFLSADKSLTANGLSSWRKCRICSK